MPSSFIESLRRDIRAANLDPGFCQGYTSMWQNIGFDNRREFRTYIRMKSVIEKEKYDGTYKEKGNAVLPALFILTKMWKASSTYVNAYYQ